jgi:hypothetical protein
MRHARLTLCFLAAAAALRTAAAADWIDIFPDAKLTHWTRISIPPGKPVDPVNQWHADVANRLLLCDGDRGHEWLRYDREFSDFVLHAEFRYIKVEGATRYNSGIFARNDADGKIWHQAQIGGASGGYLFGDTPVGGVTKRVNLRPQMREMRVSEAGEWNTVEIVCRGDRMTLSVNGAVTSDWEHLEVLRGYVGLEAEGWKIEFRNLKVKPL